MICQPASPRNACGNAAIALLIVTMSLLSPTTAKAAATDPPVRYVQESKLWVLETDHTSYIVGINEQNALQNLYWGKKITRDQDFAPAHTTEKAYPFESPEGMTNEEFPGWGGMRYTEPCLKVSLADGVRDLGAEVRVTPGDG